MKTLLIITIFFAGTFLILTACTNEEMQEDFYLGASASAGSASGGSSSASPKDSDSDGLSDSLESKIGTDPTKADSDYDGYADGIELITKSDPLNDRQLPNTKLQSISLSTSEVVSNDTEDSDEDGLGDLFETNKHLDKNNPDIDGDEFSDGLELLAGSDPFDADDKPSYTDPQTELNPQGTEPIDTDRDGLSNQVEKDMQTLDNNSDTDSDGFSDALEYLVQAAPGDAKSIPDFDVPKAPASSSVAQSSMSSVFSISSSEETSSEETTDPGEE
ncbi:MAG: hypothetical protein IT292_05135 [Deltaproteobacteria bacterium]|nr:hypothetical protein [Deltaproteobacteria bacterium]